MLRKFLYKFMIAIILFLCFSIIIKNNNSFKDVIYANLYASNFSFAKINKYIEENFGFVFPMDISKTSLVFDEKLVYENAKTYYDGVSLGVSDNYLVPCIESGIVVFIGDKENYGKTIIVEQEDGIEVWYSNISSSNLEMYEYVDSGSIIGEVDDNILYLVFQNDGEYLDCNEFI